MGISKTTEEQRLFGSGGGCIMGVWLSGIFVHLPCFFLITPCFLFSCFGVCLFWLVLFVFVT